jgi:light-regulated signal transduction histidine kinase (bacteriophytochrome)/CheY-like chemotaxis protein
LILTNLLSRKKRLSKSHNTKATTDNHVDLTSCDREPIHILSKIQSFGVLISVTPDWIVNHLSQNAHAFLQVDDKLAVGSSLVGVISDQALHDIRGRLQLLNSADSMERLFAVALFDDDRNFDVAVHRSGRSIIIEFEKTDSSSDRDYLNYIKPMISRIEQSSSVEQLSQLAARQLKAILNFDRVMVYRFLPDDTGEVIAEAKQPNMSSFLNLRYPASDIPKQARALYKRSLLRIISDVNDEGVPILPVLGAENEPLDLSLSITRAVSSIHLEYLKNMGVEASLSISIIVRGKLWGLFACHNTTPRNVGFGIRSMSELFAQMFSYVLDQKESEERAEVAMRGQILHDQIMTQLADGNSIADNFEVISNALASTIPYDGVSIWANGQYMLQGDGPNSEQFQGMLSFLNTTAQGSVYSTQNLSEKYPPAAEFVDVAAGILAIPISRSPRDYLVLYRREIVKSVNWAGNPEKPAKLGPNGIRLTPRKSFESWREIVKGSCANWSEEEIRIASNLRVTLLEVVLRLTDNAVKERSKAQEQQELLIAELNHRVRNILNLIRGLINQSKDNSKDIASFTEVVGGRIHALALAHDQITKENWNPASLSELIYNEASAYMTDNNERIIIKGSDVLIAPEAFTVLALVMHEMITNSVKYGGLCDNRGRLDITLERDQDGGLVIHWMEVGGPPVKAPKRRGFGTTIIERSIPHELRGSAEISYNVSGVTAKFVIPENYITNTLTKPVVASDPDIKQAEARMQTPDTVLIVEDNMIISLDAEDHFRALGSQNVHMTSNVAQAFTILENEAIDFALLDFNLGVETSEPVAEKLLEMNIPFVFASGYGDLSEIKKELAGIDVLQKPYGKEDILKALKTAK